MKLEIEFFEKVRIYIIKLIKAMEEGTYSLQQLCDDVKDNAEILKDIKKILPNEIYVNYEEFFCELGNICELCENTKFFDANAELVLSSFDLYLECIESIIIEYKEKIKKCGCCGADVIYKPLSMYYKQMEEKYYFRKSVPETLNTEKYMCPMCEATDRDRIIIEYLKRAKVTEASDELKLIQIAPSGAIDKWINKNCPHIQYETSDMYMDNVSFKADVQDMNMVKDNTYDIIICSHVLEHVQDDKKALNEFKRILKPDGSLILLVPIDLSSDEIDEEWGLSEEENWRRFGQNDHCRSYGKKGFINRLEECGWHINSLGKDYFGDECFRELELTDTSVLYVLTKDKDVSLDKSYKFDISDELLENGPLVSVIMSCYNHEEFVAETIESVINQTYKNIEFIVADDASTDNSVAVMKKYSQYFASESYFDTNYYHRQWELAEKTTGKYVAMINSDDVWELEKLAYQVQYMEEHEDIVACFTYTDMVDEKLNCVYDKFFYVKNRTRYEWMETFWKEGNKFCYPSILIRREMYLELFKSKKVCRQLPDFFQWVDLVQKGNVYVMPKQLVKMRFHSSEKVTNTSTPNKENMVRDYVERMTHWMYEIEEMDKEFFIKAFNKDFVRKEASSEEEIICEKFFLMYNDVAKWSHNNAFYYYMKMSRNDKVRECFEQTYKFKMQEVFSAVVEKGIGSILYENDLTIKKR